MVDEGHVKYLSFKKKNSQCQNCVLKKPSDILICN